MPARWIATPRDIELIKKLYCQDRLSQRQVAYRMKISVNTLRNVMREARIEVRGAESRKKYPSKHVVRYEERPYDQMADGRLKTKTVAILECGHIVKVWEKRLPYELEFRAVRQCRVCPLEEEEPLDGGAEH